MHSDSRFVLAAGPGVPSGSAIAMAYSVPRRDVSHAVTLQNSKCEL